MLFWTSLKNAWIPYNPRSANLTKWPNTLKRFIGFCRRIGWVWLTIFGGLVFNGIFGICINLTWFFSIFFNTKIKIRTKLDVIGTKLVTLSQKHHLSSLYVRCNGKKTICYFKTFSACLFHGREYLKICCMFFA